MADISEVSDHLGEGHCWVKVCWEEREQLVEEKGEADEECEQLRPTAQQEAGSLAKSAETVVVNHHLSCSCLFADALFSGFARGSGALNKLPQAK